MSEKYIDYWGLTKHPFLLAPDSSMMHVTGQYYECLERLKYAINTNKGGVLVISEDAGLGKTTILLKLIEEMRAEYNGAFRFAFVDHPSLTADQIIAQITGAISGLTPFEDKLKNLSLLKSALVEVKEQGGKSVIVVDEGQMLCDTRDVLQELRILINLTHNNEYLHTFILAGQRDLWQTIKDMPEFWQRLPVRYYFVPLRLDEAKELIRHRLIKAGMEPEREIFSDDALEIIHKYSRGSPRTLIALSDLSLLIGYSARTGKVGFKEVSKAMNAMSGKGESLPYTGGETQNRRSPSPGLSASRTAGKRQRPQERSSASSPEAEDERPATGNEDRSRVVLIALVATLSIIIGALVGYFLMNTGKPEVPPTASVRKEVQNPVPLPPPQMETGQPQPSASLQTTSVQPPPPVQTVPPAPSVPTQAVAVQQATVPAQLSSPGVKAGPPPIPVKQEKTAEVIKDAVNARSQPDVDSTRIGVIFKGAALKVKGEKVGRDGSRWYKVALYGNRDGWISGDVVKVK